MNFDVNGLFNPENRFWSFMEKLMNLCVAGLLWFLFSLPLITVGAATTALFGYTLKLARNEEGYLWKGFWKGFKENFVTSTLLWLGVVGAGVFLGVDLFACQFLPMGGAVRWGARTLLASLIFVYFLTIIYLFPLVAAFRISLKKAVRDALLMGVGNLYVSVTVLVIYGIFGVVTWFFPVLFMVWFALAAYFSSHLLYSVFMRYLPEGDELDKEGW
ncbi:MAG: DUF624 domain-containing protein [Lachnospiraceae bacterium]|jgi:uncharacterized membrane protein YesL|nr:DUF624 domain-containing protein [Lachnospiraceae bacterium]